MSFKNLREYQTDIVSMPLCKISTNQQAQIDKIYEDYTYTCSIDNFHMLTCDSHQPLQVELNDFESNLENLIYVLEHSNGTIGGNMYSSKYLVAEDFISKYTK
jgi:hypothetical protein